MVRGSGHPGEVSSRQIKHGCAICELRALIVLCDGTASQTLRCFLRLGNCRRDLMLKTPIDYMGIITDVY